MWRAGCPAAPGIPRGAERPHTPKGETPNRDRPAAHPNGWPVRRSQEGMMLFAYLLSLLPTRRRIAAYFEAWA